MIEFYDTFPAHFFIEMCYGRKNRYGFIYEQNLSHRDFKTLCESYGVFNGCDKIAEEIINLSEKAYLNGKKSFNININNCSFIDKVEVIFEEGGMCAYFPNFSKIINKKFKPLNLKIGLKCVKEKQIALIMHELTHAYEDYQRNIKNVQGLDDKAKKLGYYKNPMQSTPYYELSKRKVSYILYHLTDFERNAYIASIKGLFNQSNNKFNNIKEALQYIRQTVFYRNYQKIFEWGKTLCNESDKTRQNEILQYVEELSNFKFNTYNKFVKWLSSKILKYQEKFNKIIPKIAAEHFIMAESFNNAIDYLIEI